MIGKTLPEYIFILFSIHFLRLIAPASILYIIFYVYNYSINGTWTSNNALISPLILSYAILEIIFLVGVHWTRKRRLAKEPLFETPVQTTRSEREELFARCAGAIVSTSDTGLLSSYPSGWFFPPNSKPLKRQNVVEWILWALFACEPQDASLEEWEDEINGYIKNIEERLGYKLEEGYSKDSKSMRLTFDYVKVLYRPLIWYIIIGLVDHITAIRLYFLGFTHFSPNRSIFSIFPFRLFSLFSRRSATPYLPYWYRPHKSTTKNPIVFIHGIGIGLYPYVPLLSTLCNEEDPSVGILLIELLPISNRIRVNSRSSIFPVPIQQTMLDALYSTMNSLGPEWNKAVLATHSYGTVVAAYDMRSRAAGKSTRNYQDDEDSQVLPTPVSTPTFTSYLFVDPIPFLLHLPPVAYNFLYREPWRRPHSSSASSSWWTGYNGNEWQLWYFASRDLEVAYTLTRRFFWDELVLWKEDIPQGTQIAVVLSGGDQIVPADAVRGYLVGDAGEEQGRLLAQGWSKQQLEMFDHYLHDETSRQVLYYPGLDHATVFDTTERRNGLVGVLRGMCASVGTNKNVGNGRPSVVVQ